MRRLPLLALVVLAACGPVAGSPRATVPGLDPLSGALGSVEVELPGADLSAVRGPAGTVLVNGWFEQGRVAGGSSPDCALRRSSSGVQIPQSSRCAALLGAYAALEKARAFLLSAGAEGLAPAQVLADPQGPAPEAPPGLRYQPSADAFTLVGGPAGARVPASLNPGAVARELARRHLREWLEVQPAEVEGVALFLGAAACGDPGYLASSQPEGDPRGELDLARPLGPQSAPGAVVAQALWAWAEASGDLVGASRAALAAVRALGSGRSGPDPALLLSLVAAQLDGTERDQACAVFRARALGPVPACP